jgi:Carbohydrate family 9 binding domain-like
MTVALLAAGAYGADLTVDVLAAGVAPAIDGKLDDAVWQEGDWHSGFKRLNKPEITMEVQTRFKIAADESAVYVAIRADEPDVANQIKTVTERDGKVFHDDCLEVMLGGDPDGSRYLHFIVNPLGTLYDAQIFNEGNEQTEAWDSGCTVAVAAESEAWTVELAIPIVDVGVTVGGRAGWILNVTRERRIGDLSELSTFAPLTGGFHQPSHYARLQLPELDLSPYLWGVRYPYDFAFVPEGDQLVCTAKTHLENQTGAFRFLVVRPTWTINGRKTVGADVAGGLDTGQAKEFTFSLPLTQQGQGLLTLEVRDRKNPDVLWAVRKRQMELRYVPILVDVTRPHYRNNIYATESLDEIRATVRLAVAPEKRAGAALKVSFAPEGGAGTPIVERSRPADSESVDIALPVPELAEGRYTLAVELARGPEVIERTETLIRKLPKVAHEWRIDEKNALLHNGEPVLPFGWFSMPVDRMAEPDCPYNVAQDYGGYWASVEENRATWDKFAAAGKYVTTYPYPSPRMVSPSEVWGKPLTGEEATALRERVRALKDHPGLFAWYLADEPELRPALPERTRQIYRVIADEDPYHPCIMLNDTISGVYKYVDGGDVLMPDPYPCFVADGLAALPLEKVTEFMKACNEASQGRRALWITPQAFNYGDYGRENNRAPTFDELRNMTYQAVIEETKGFLYYTWRHSLNYMGVQVCMPFLARETADLKDAILANDSGEAVEIAAPFPEHVQTSVRHAGGHVYLFATSTATQPQEVRFTCPNMPGDVDQLHVVSENRSVAVAQGGVFSDRFDRYGTHIYTCDAATAQRETVAAALAEVDRLDAARNRLGNLAFEDNGTTITVSSKSTYGSTPERLLDGVREGMGWRDKTARECPDWLEVVWSAPLTVGRIVTCTTSVEDAAVLVPDGEGWKELAAVTGATEPELTFTFPAVTTNRVRVEVRKNRTDEKYTWITEVEAYGE